MFKTIFATLIGCMLFVTAFAQNEIVGKWWTPNKDGQIEIFRSGNQFYGKIVWGKNARKDTKNPKPELRNRDLLGAMIFSNFKYDEGSKQWKEGTIYDPDSGKTYNCKIWLTDNNNTMNVRGFIGISLLGRTEKFTKVLGN